MRDSILAVGTQDVAIIVKIKGDHRPIVCLSEARLSKSGSVVKLSSHLNDGYLGKSVSLLLVHSQRTLLRANCQNATLDVSSFQSTHARNTVPSRRTKAHRTHSKLGHKQPFCHPA